MEINDFKLVNLFKKMGLWINIKYFLWIYYNEFYVLFEVSSSQTTVFTWLFMFHVILNSFEIITLINILIWIVCVDKTYIDFMWPECLFS